MIPALRALARRLLSSAFVVSSLVPCVFGVTTATASSFVTDIAVHAPPASGPYAYYATYGAFSPDQSGFPVVGGSFVDPVFGSTIRRLTNEVGQMSNSDIYSKNGFFNADGSLVFHHSPTSRQIISTATGAVVRSGVAFTYDSSFAPDDRDRWYYFAWGSPTLYRYSVSTGTRYVVKTFPGALGPLGGSVDWIDRTGRYMVLDVGGRYTVYDKRDDVLYAGGAPDTFMGGPVTLGGWVGISPDGNYMVTETPSVYHHSWKIDHVNRTVSTTPVLFWTLCGGHGDVMTASNGKTYYVGFDCHTTGGVYRVDVTLPQTTTNVTQQLSQNLKLLQPSSWADSHGHFSRVSTGTLRDWVFASMETPADGFTSSVSTWRRFEQEILMMNVLTGEVRRLAHHRSRGISGSYFYEPRANATWDGRLVAWVSNFGLGATRYADLYVLPVDTSTTATVSLAAPLAVSFTTPASGATVSGTTTVSETATGGSGTGYTYALAIDGTPVAMTGASYAWNTTSVANGTHTLVATATDSTGATATATRSVTVQNTVTSAPAVGFVNPTSGATVSGTVAVSLSASGGSGTGYTYVVTAAATTIYSGTNNSFSWNTTTTANGSVTLTATVTDSAGRSSTTSRAVTVSNVTISPLTAVFTGPVNGATVSGSTPVAFGATGGTSPYTYAVSLDGSTTVYSGATGSFSWNTTSVANGSHTLTVTATDAASRTASASLAVTVSNTTATASFTASITYPTIGTIFTGYRSIGMSTTAPWSQPKTFTLTVDGNVIFSQTKSVSSLYYSWNSRTAANGTHTLTLSVTYNGQTASASRSITVKN